MSIEDIDPERIGSGTVSQDPQHDEEHEDGSLHLDSLAALMARRPPWQEVTGPDGDGLLVLVEGAEERSGLWKVTTRSSVHVFDLDRSLYLRSTSGDNIMPHDGRWCALTRMPEPPQVGGRFLIWIDDPDAPHALEHWRVSSRISAITPTTPEDLPPA